MARQLNVRITIRHPRTKRPMGEIVKVEVVEITSTIKPNSVYRIIKAVIDSDGVRYNIRRCAGGDGVKLIIPPVPEPLDLPFVYGAAITNVLDRVCESIGAWYI